MKIVVTGNIGSGKRALLRGLGSRITNSLLVEERFGLDSELASFFKTQKKCEKNAFPNSEALNLQLTFLKARFDNEVTSIRAEHRCVIQQRSLFEDRLIFAEAQRKLGTLSQRDFEHYLSLFEERASVARAPTLLFYLRAKPAALRESIRRRGLNHEAILSDRFLETLNEQYEELESGLKRFCPKVRFVPIDVEGKSQEEILNLAVSQVE